MFKYKYCILFDTNSAKSSNNASNNKGQTTTPTVSKY